MAEPGMEDVRLALSGHAVVLMSAFRGKADMDPKLVSGGEECPREGLQVGRHDVLPAIKAPLNHAHASQTARMMRPLCRCRAFAKCVPGICCPPSAMAGSQYSLKFLPCARELENLG